MARHKTSLMRIFLISTLAVLIFSPIIATAKPSPLSISQKIHNLGTILSQAARGKLGEADITSIQKLLQDAEAALKAADSSTAEKLYSQAWEAYQAAVKVAQTQDHKANEEMRLAARITSTKALLKRLEDVDKETGARNAAQIENVKSLLAQAEAAKDTVKALALANQAYYTTKILLKDARDGKTLSFDHTFSTPALKYADEIAYNDAHFGLLDTALEQLHVKADDEYNNYINSAKKLRKQAEKEAEQNNHESGIHDIVLSTIEIKKALQHIGLPVPGL